MLRAAKYASLAIVDWQPGGVAIETLSIIEGECVLAGAWFLEIPDVELVARLISHRLCIQFGEVAPRSFILDFSTRPVTTETFLRDAQNECDLFTQEFEAFKSANPPKGINLVRPVSTNWPTSLYLNQAKEHLKVLKRAPSVIGTDPKMEKVLAASRLAKWMIDGWIQDEQQRFERRFSSVRKSGKRILPPSWLEMV